MWLLMNFKEIFISLQKCCIVLIRLNFKQNRFSRKSRSLDIKVILCELFYLYTVSFHRKFPHLFEQPLNRKIDPLSSLTKILQISLISWNFSRNKAPNRPFLLYTSSFKHIKKIYIERHIIQVSLLKMFKETNHTKFCINNRRKTKTKLSIRTYVVCN